MGPKDSSQISKKLVSPFDEDMDIHENTNHNISTVATEEHELLNSLPERFLHCLTINDGLKDVPVLNHKKSDCNLKEENRLYNKVINASCGDNNKHILSSASDDILLSGSKHSPLTPGTDFCNPKYENPPMMENGKKTASICLNTENHNIATSTEIDSDRPSNGRYNSGSTAESYCMVNAEVNFEVKFQSHKIKEHIREEGKPQNDCSAKIEGKKLDTQIGDQMICNGSLPSEAIHSNSLNNESHPIFHSLDLSNNQTIDDKNGDLSVESNIINKTYEKRFYISEPELTSEEIMEEICIAKLNGTRFIRPSTSKKVHHSTDSFNDSFSKDIALEPDFFRSTNPKLQKPKEIAGRPIPVYFQSKDPKEINSNVNIRKIFKRCDSRRSFRKSESKYRSAHLDRKERSFHFKGQLKVQRKRIYSIYSSRRQNKGLKKCIQILTEKKIQLKNERKGEEVKVQQILQHCSSRTSCKVKRIGPHVEVYEAFHPVKNDPSSQDMIRAAVCIQRFIRGWLVRTCLNRIKIKAENHGSSLTNVVTQYHKMMNRLQCRFGVVKPSTPLIFTELEEWLDRKTMYEGMFSKQEFWKKMEISELPDFFRNCDHYPTKQEIEDTWCKINYGSSLMKQTEALTKQQVVEAAFTLYPPKGARLSSTATYQSAWINPIMDGMDGYQYLVTDHPVLKEADICVVGELVATSIRERKERLASAQKPLSDGNKEADAPMFGVSH
ncbi:uncharacterized protein IQCM isoform X2 [Latimeria chalumnae]